MSLSSRCRSSLMRIVRLLIGIADCGNRIPESFRKGYPVSGIRNPVLKCGAHLLHFVALDDVAHGVTVEIVQLDAALEAGADFVGVVLEALERGNLALVHHFLAAAE